jgi:hypothetical protein
MLADATCSVDSDDNYVPRAFANCWTENNKRNIGHMLRNEDEYLLSHPRTD